MKKILAVLLISLMMVSLITAPVLAAKEASKIEKTSFYPVSGGSSNNVQTDLDTQGKVTVNTPKGKTTLIINGKVTGLVPKHFYTVWVRTLIGYTGDAYNSDPSSGYYLLGSFKTNTKGIGSFHLNLRSKDLPYGTYSIQVAINDVPEASFPAVIGTTVLATPKWISVTTVGK